ncbi:hypothetical protein CIT25_10260 [Mesorhizobium mediterraneum]|uniref:Lytic murein transglycosylase n=1 Tax=Mesorhizobium mediterraneum TaxID=43617 RepID=A0AB36RB57_9HYPH|nr:hypothetical protein CIT25_10260 [Mesorhizobium mediterraneum]
MQKIARRWRDSAPLCPAGHLPHLGGDWQLRRPAQLPALVVGESGGDPISPLVGEMSGRTEGGAVPPMSAENTRLITAQQ